MLVGEDRQNMVASVIKALNRGDLRRAAKEMVDNACGVDSVFENLDRHDQQVFLDNAETIPAMFANRSDSFSSSMIAVDLQKIRCRVTIGTGALARPVDVVGDCGGVWGRTFCPPLFAVPGPPHSPAPGRTG